MPKNKVTVTYADGRIILDVDGHTDGEVCMAISAITQTAILGLAQIAEEYPQHAEITYVTEGNDAKSD